MTYSSRFWLYAPLAMFLALASWAMAHWWIVASALDRKLTALNGHEAVPGITVSYTSKTISGFPFNLDVVFTGFKIAGAGAHGPFAWSSERFALHALTYGRAQQIYEAAGQQTLSWSDGKGKSHSVEFLPGSERASAIVDATGLSHFDLDIVAAGGRKDGGAPFTIGRAQFHMRRNPTLDVMVSADDVKFAVLQVHTLTAYATLTQSGALAPLLAGARSWPEAVAAWRSQGGMVQIGKGDASLADDILSPLY